jgi:hypothetical protein
MGNLVKAILEFDPRMLNTVLQKEYEYLEKGKGSYFYGFARMFLNALLLGPGMGTDKAVNW